MVDKNIAKVQCTNTCINFNTANLMRYFKIYENFDIINLTYSIKLAYAVLYIIHDHVN